VKRDSITYLALALLLMSSCHAFVVSVEFEAEPLVALNIAFTTRSAGSSETFLWLHPRMYHLSINGTKLQGGHRERKRRREWRRWRGGRQRW
jgi:hypothetical protein